MIKPGKSFFRIILSTVIVASIFYFLLTDLLNNYHMLSSYDLEIEYWRMSGSLLLLVMVFLFHPVAWMLILGEMSEKMGFRKTFSILYISQLGKYVPGKMWSYVGQMYLAEKEGIHKEKTLISSILFQLLSMGTTVVFFGVSLLMWDNIPLPLRLFGVPSFVAVVLIFLKVDGLNWFIRLIVNRIFRRELFVRLKFGTVAAVITVFLGSWIAYSIAYFCFIRSFYLIDPIQSICFSGIYAISWLVGYLSFLTPGGLGVREGMQVFLLSQFIPLPVSIIISLASRIWLTTGEITVALISLFLINRGSGGKADQTVE